MTAFCNLLGSLVGLYFVDTVGRRRLTLVSLGAVVSALVGIAICFFYAQIFSQSLNDIPLNDNECGAYDWCFDCVQDDGCGYCDIDGVSACIPAADVDDDTKSAFNSSMCPAANFHGESCPGAGSSNAGWLIFAAVCAYLLAFSPGMGPMPWCVNSEIYPTSIRGVGNSIATCVNWSANFLMSLTFLTLTSKIGSTGSFLLYASIGSVFFLFFYRYLPETKGLQLEDMESVFSDSRWGQANGRGCCSGGLFR